MDLRDFRTLGRSGLNVSPLCLGTMTFGEDWGWGSSADTARQMFAAYIEAGGNFIDTADGYVNGQSEELVGRFVPEHSKRDNVIIATKYTFSAEPGNPNAGGNGRKNVMRALEGSLRRLQTDYIDLYWMHAWDRKTPVEEVLLTMNDLVRSGKIRYYGLSDVPSWYIAKMHTLAQQQGLHPPIALQLEYSLVERSIEYEFIDAAAELGLGICPWSPLGGGILTGKYKRDKLDGLGRLGAIKDSGNESVDKLFTSRNWDIADAVAEVAKATNKTPAQVALNWVIGSPGVTSTIIGATKLHQLQDNLEALQFELTHDQRLKLNESSEPASIHPYVFFGKQMQSMISGGTRVKRWLEQVH
jgi:aryl-alcohol dehydrogenase-like predicted oxidoreductase